MSYVDGNALAGPLREIFAVDVTVAVSRCVECGRTGPLATLRVYTDAPGPKRWLIERFGTNEWPSFNVADSAICIGIGLFVLHYFLFEKDDKTVEPDPPTKTLAG